MSRNVVKTYGERPKCLIYSAACKGVFLMFHELHQIFGQSRDTNAASHCTVEYDVKEDAPLGELDGY